MKLEIFKNPDALGKAAAGFCEEVLNKTIAEKGEARIVLSTGASQFDTFKHLVEADIDWSKVEMFHLDEYVDLPETHPASFRKYLKERFVQHVNLKKAYFVDGEGDIEKKIKELSDALLEKPVDLALIGIGENAHIAFNDPPADFETMNPYIVVNLPERCKLQQVSEGWFATTDDVPNRAISMSVHMIMKSRTILTCAPYAVKADAIKKTLENEVSNLTPATILKTHPDWHLYLDRDSAALIDKN